MHKNENVHFIDAGLQSYDHDVILMPIYIYSYMNVIHVLIMIFVSNIYSFIYHTGE